MRYQEKEIRSQEDYIFEGTAPYNPEFDLEELKIIERKLIDYTSGNSKDGLNPNEAEIFLDWITFNARRYAVGDKDIETADMYAQCAPTQRVNVKLLRKLGLDARSFNTGDCIKEAGGIEEDNFFGSKAVRHSLSIVDIPIIDNNGNTAEYKYLLDPTFRQFCLKENCNIQRFEQPVKGCVAPHPGYFMQKENLQHLGVSQETAKKTEELGKFIISKGYFYLNEETAKLYGDTFVRASKRLDAQNISINISGEEYIQNFENIHMNLIESDKNDWQYTKLPSEIKQPKQGIFSMIKDIFKKIFNKNDTKALPEGQINIPTNNPYEEFRKQYKFKGEVEGVNKGRVQQLDTLVKNNDNNIDYENEI